MKRKYDKKAMAIVKKANELADQRHLDSRVFETKTEEVIVENFSGEEKFDDFTAMLNRINGIKKD